MGQDRSAGRQDLVSKSEGGKGTGREVDMVRSKICGSRRSKTGHKTQNKHVLSERVLWGRVSPQ